MNSPRRLRKGEVAPQYVPKVRPAEQLMVDALADVQGERILCNSSGRAQFAFALAIARPQSQVTCWFLDVHLRDQAALAPAGVPANLQLVCEPDFPGVEYQTICLVLPKTGEAELTRDLLQQACVRLVDGGTLIATTDMRDDQWLHTEIQRFFPKVTRRPTRKGVTYLAIKTESPKKLKNHDCEFMFRDGERLIRMKSRPGVFAHRKLDVGARTLISVIEPMEKGQIVDLGCGSGGVAVAAALRHPELDVLAVDSNPRAIECTQWAAQENGTSRVQTRLDATGKSLESNSVDVVYANPPYFSNYKIAGIFVETAFRILIPGGRIYIVTKAPAWYVESLPLLFENVTSDLIRGYSIVKATKSMSGKVPAPAPEYEEYRSAKPRRRKPKLYEE
ncbi:Ribosomal RNA small subunit methyltransferase C [Planctopirus ephydatiae]|uniref:Ribosomal RNA small subunit methyltransferase C n=1 Tax=Planctopirus ephydatiae TaxID=2528019 RepID=A0A518GQY9_9PLAN|nr:methyltransferase [Planctopirus ephydatiae]QDV31016.1 Ribosomal RNA small subunit methyltransferase C [Planctopirus ephydatiae]